MVAVPESSGYLIKTREIIVLLNQRDFSQEMNSAIHERDNNSGSDILINNDEKSPGPDMLLINPMEEIVPKNNFFTRILSFRSYLT
jgi:hypothetical protein